jgi:glycosyltransferase involved in cell wall biosynthesis
VKVTALIPAYNSAAWITEALDSVAAQTAPPDEVIVVDDGSTDDTAGIAESLGATCLRPGRVGVSAARNVGVRAASGELIALLDSDDVWTPDKLEVQAGQMRSRPELLYTITHFSHFQDGSPVDGIREDVLEGVHPGWLPSTLVARREAFDIVGEFDESMPSGGDIDWFSRAVDLDAAMDVLPQMLLLKRAHNDSLMWTRGHTSLFLSLRRSLARKRAEEAGA